MTYSAFISNPICQSASGLSFDKSSTLPLYQLAAERPVYQALTLVPVSRKRTASTCLRLSPDKPKLATENEPEAPPGTVIHQAGNPIFAASSAFASVVSAGLTYPFSAALSKAIADGMRLPQHQDLAFDGMSTSAGKSVLQTALVEFLKPNLNRLAKAGCHTEAQENKANTGTDQDNSCKGSYRPHLTAEFLSTFGTNIAVTLLTVPIETLAMRQNQDKLSLLAAAQSVLKHNPDQFWATLQSTFISLNITWFLRLYARLKASGNLAQEKKISAKLSAFSSPFKSWLKCVKSRQLLQQEPLIAAAITTTHAMIRQPLNTAVLIGLNVLIAAVIGQSIYFSTRHMFQKCLSHATSQSSNPENK